MPTTRGRPRRRSFGWRRYVRRRSTHWLLAVVLALVTAWVAGTAIAGAEAARRRWGDERVVAVAARHLDAGTTIAASDVTLERWPSAVVPAGAADDVPAGRVVVAPIEPGEAVLAARLAPDGLHGLTALVAPGWRGFALPSDPGSLRLEVGDVVDVLATLEPAAAGGTGDEPTRLVAESAQVIAVDERSVTVAVPADASEDIAFALASGTITLALRTP